MKWKTPFLIQILMGTVRTCSFFDMEELGMPKDTAGFFHSTVHRLKLHMQMLKYTLCLANHHIQQGSCFHCS